MKVELYASRSNQEFSNRQVPAHIFFSLYQSKLCESHRTQVRGCTYEKFIAEITGGEDILKWKSYLERRYLVLPVSVS